MGSFYQRFAFTDYAVVSVLLDALHDGISDVGLHYDIMCHYQKNMWAHWATINIPACSLNKQDFSSFLCTAPKFHLAGHTDQCSVRFPLNTMTGVGRLDGEGAERCWANLNLAARSTSERGPGACVDSICHVMDQWNWSKTTEMGELPSKSTDLSMTIKISLLHPSPSFGSHTFGQTATSRLA